MNDFTNDDLRSWRSDMGLTQPQAAEAICIPFETYRSLEEGRRAIKPHIVKATELLTAALP